MPRAIHCFILGCSSSSTDIFKWKNGYCTDHAVFRKFCTCTCTVPYTFIRFPLKKSQRNIWIKIANRRDLKLAERTLLRPADYECVCSKHFVVADGREVNNAVDVPNANLGYDDPEYASEIIHHIYDTKLVPGMEDIPIPQDPTTGSERMLMEASTSGIQEQHENIYPPIELEQEETLASGSAKNSSEESSWPESLPNSPSSKRKVSKRNRQFSQLLGSESSEDDFPVKKKFKSTVVSSHAQSTEITLRDSDNNSDSMLLLATPELDSSTSATSTATSSSNTDADTSSPLPVNTPVHKRKDSMSIQDLRFENSRLRARITILQHKYEKISMKYLMSAKKPPELLTDDAAVKFYTGFANFETYNGFFKILEPLAHKMRFWHAHSTPVDRIKRKYKHTPKKSGPKRHLPLQEEYLMTLMRLKLGLYERDLADRFSVTVDYVSRTLITWIKFLADEWRCLIFVPTRQNIQETLPQAFKNTPFVRHIIDGTEIFVQSTGDLMLQVLLWSQYKHHHTAKFLIAIAPNGHITFVSKAYGGRITDKEITKVSSFYDVLEEFDEVMADKGFPIAIELNEKLCSLRMPKGRRGIDQFTNEDISSTKKIAKARIHVERAINRVKVFHILSGDLNLYIVSQLSDIMVICCAICNTLPPLIRE